MLSNEAYRAAYEFHTRWAPFPESPEAWLLAAEDIGNTSKANGDTPLIIGLLMAVWDDMAVEYHRKGANTA